MEDRREVPNMPRKRQERIMRICPNPIRFDKLQEEVSNEFPSSMYDLLLSYLQITDHHLRQSSEYFLARMNRLNAIFPVITDPYRLSWKRINSILHDFGRSVSKINNDLSLDWDAKVSPRLQQKMDLITSFISNPQPHTVFLLKRTPPRQNLNSVHILKKGEYIEKRGAPGDQSDEEEEVEIEMDEPSTSAQSFTVPLRPGFEEECILIAHDSMLIELIARNYLNKIKAHEKLFDSLSKIFCGFNKAHVRNACKVLRKVQNSRENCRDRISEVFLWEACHVSRSSFNRFYEKTVDLCDWFEVASHPSNPMWWDARNIEMENPEPRHPYELGALALHSFQGEFISPDMENLYRNIAFSMNREECCVVHGDPLFFITMMWDLRNGHFHADYDYICRFFVDRMDHYKLALKNDIERGSGPMTRIKVKQRFLQLYLLLQTAILRSASAPLRDPRTLIEAEVEAHFVFRKLLSKGGKYWEEMDAFHYSSLLRLPDAREEIEKSTTRFAANKKPGMKDYLPNPATVGIRESTLGISKYLNIVELDPDFEKTDFRPISEMLSHLLRGALQCEKNMGWSYLELAIDVLLQLDDPEPFAVCFSGASSVVLGGQTLDEAIRTYLFDFLAKSPELAYFVYKLFLRIEHVEDARMMLHEIPQLTTPLHEADSMWLEWSQNQMEEEKSENYVDVALKMLAYLDYGSNKNEIGAWETLAESLDELQTDMTEEGRHALSLAWKERQDWWPIFHQTRQGEEEELTALKEKVIAALLELHVE